MKRDDVLDFFTQLDRLPKGDRTALKREAGTMLHEAGGRAIQAFVCVAAFALTGRRAPC